MTPRNGQPKRITVSLDDPAFAAFTEFAALAYPEQPLSAAVREACLVYMGTDPMEAARVSARRTAYLEARREVSATIAQLLRAVTMSFTNTHQAAIQELLTSEV